MSKIEEFISQNHLLTGSADLPNARQTNSQNVAKNLGAQPNADAQKHFTPHDGAASAPSPPQKNDLMNRLPLAGQMLRHNLHSKNEPAELPKNAAQAVHQGLVKHAEKAGLPIHEQKEFAQKFAQKFVHEAKAKGQENSVGKNGDFSALTNNQKTVHAKVNGNAVGISLGAEATADLKARQAKLGVKAEVGNDAINVKVNLKSETNAKNDFVHDANQKANGNLDASAKKGVKTEANPTKNNANVEINAKTQTNSEANVKNKNPNQESGVKTNAAIRQELIQNRFAARPQFAASLNPANVLLRGAQTVSRREIAELKIALEKRIADILRRVGVDAAPAARTGGAAGEFAAADKTPEQLRESAQVFGNNNQTAEDNALFASALNIAAESAGESRTRNGDGLLLEFANYGDGKKDFSFDQTVGDLLQTGSQVGVETLLDAATIDLSDSALDGLTQLVAGSQPESAKNLVVGVLTMSVMTREVVERLDRIGGDTSLGLSDDAMIALQKANNSLRDHLTAIDLIGAVGDAKGTPVSLKGETYSFLPEVSEALNSLREARSRILSETTAGVGGAESSARFAVEADSLFKITSNVEKLLKAR